MNPVFSINYMREQSKKTVFWCSRMQLISLHIVPLFYEVTERVRLDHPYSVYPKDVVWPRIAQATDNPEDENEGRQPRSRCTSVDVKNSTRVDRSKWDGLFVWQTRRRSCNSSLSWINEEIQVCDQVSNPGHVLALLQYAHRWAFRIFYHSVCLSSGCEIPPSSCETFYCREYSLDKGSRDQGGRWCHA